MGKEVITKIIKKATAEESREDAFTVCIEDKTGHVDPIKAKTQCVAFVIHVKDEEFKSGVMGAVNFTTLAGTISALDDLSRNLKKEAIKMGLQIMAEGIEED